MHKTYWLMENKSKQNLLNDVAHHQFTMLQKKLLSDSSNEKKFNLSSHIYQCNIMHLQVLQE